MAIIKSTRRRVFQQKMVRGKALLRGVDGGKVRVRRF